jgi:predicted nucleic acid-binding protein
MFPIRSWSSYGGKSGKAGNAKFSLLGRECSVPLCVRQSMTPQAIALYKTHDAVVWWATPVEIASALARLMRMKQIDSRTWAKASKLAKSLADSWSVIQPSDALRATSIHLVGRYDLRAADSFQLAAAPEWCEHAPQGRIFLATDQRLREAALLNGFDAKQI